MITREQKKMRQAMQKRQQLEKAHDAEIQKRLDIIGMSLQEFRSRGVKPEHKDRIWDMVEAAERKVK